MQWTSGLADVTRRGFLVRAAAAVGTCALAGCGLPLLNGRGSVRKPRIGVVFGSSPDAAAPLINAFRAGLREHGYVEGETILVDWRFADGRNERLPQLLRELIQDGIDLLMIPNRVGVAAAKELTATVPIVMTDVADVVEIGLVPGLAHPGANVTGVAAPSLEPKRLELLHDALPTGRARFGVLWRPTDGSTIARQKLLAAAQVLGVSIWSFELQGPEDLATAFESAVQADLDGLVIFIDPLILILMQRIVQFATERRIPAVYPDRRFVDAGGLMSFGSNRIAMYRRAATYVDQILKGSRPGDLPVQVTTDFELAVHADALRVLGITLPPHVMAQVTDWISQDSPASSATPDQRGETL
jgi:putative ABC transport system substrate-binding protein